MTQKSNSKIRKKGDILLGILDALGEGMLEVADLFEAFLSAGYGASYRRMEYELYKIKRDRAKISDGIFEERKARIRFQKLFSALKSDGLIVEAEKKESKKGKFFKLTGKGLEKIKHLYKYKQKTLPPVLSYKPEEASAVTIVTFDIPEKLRKKRDWLRTVMKQLGFRFIQKSICIGKVKIPQEFLEDLEKLRIGSFVEIFQVTKSGSLKHIE